MRYMEFAILPEAYDSKIHGIKEQRVTGNSQRDDAIRRLKDLNRRRVQLMAIAVERELRRYLSSAEMLRRELERRLV